MITRCEHCEAKIAVFGLVDILCSNCGKEAWKKDETHVNESKPQS